MAIRKWTNTYCVVFLVCFLRFVYPMLPVFSILSFLITPSILFNVYINGGENRKEIKKGQSRDTDNIEHTRLQDDEK